MTVFFILDVYICIWLLYILELHLSGKIGMGNRTENPDN